MNELLFRQAIFHPVTKEFLRWHYWGLIDGAFVGIDTGWVNPTKAVGNSQRFTGETDENEIRIYEGDIVEGTHYEEQGCKPVFWWKTGWYTGYDDGQYRNVTSLSAVINPIIIGNIYEGLYSGEHSHLLKENSNDRLTSNNSHHYIDDYRMVSLL